MQEYHTVSIHKEGLMRLTHRQTFVRSQASGARSRMKRVIALAAVLCVTAIAQAAEAPCQDALPHELKFGIPRPSGADDAANLQAALSTLLQPLYQDPCGLGKKLKISIAIGTDYEILDWIESGSVEGAIVTDLSLWLLKKDGSLLQQLNPALSATAEILPPLAPAPSCRQFEDGQWKPCAMTGDKAYAALLSDIAAGKDVGARRVMFASHLSYTGFLAPIEAALNVFSKRPKGEQREMWERLSAAAHFIVDTDPAGDPFALALDEERSVPSIEGLDCKKKLPPAPSSLTVISFPGEEAVARETTAGKLKPGPAQHEHVLIATNMSRLFRKGAFEPIESMSNPLTSQLDGALKSEHPPLPLELIARGMPASGMRPFTFTIRESLRLIQQQQASNGKENLALVLPGGGVKAAYQSRIIDYLYSGGHLRNEALQEKQGVLRVQSVLGTSGGALLGYFVSQLGEQGPFDLTGILWRPDGRTLEAGDIFAVTDMLRYLSIVWTFLVFCVLLALITGNHQSRFYSRSPTPHGAWRWRLMSVLFVFFVVPILIRFVTGLRDLEQVPVIEGMFYSILSVLVMFCDQCLVRVRDDDEVRPLRRHVLILATVGGAFVFVSFFGRNVPFMREPVTMGFAFVTLTVIFLGSAFLVLYASGRGGDWRERLGDAAGALLAVLILCAFGLPGAVPADKHIFSLFVLIGLAVFAYWYSNFRGHQRRVAALLTFLTMLAIAVLSWPDPTKFKLRLRPSGEFLTAAGLDNTHYAPFLVSTGCLLLVIAATVWVYQRREYSLEAGEDFALGLALLLVHAVVTGVTVSIIAWLLPTVVHDVEVTLSFWISVTVVGLVLGILILMAARRAPLVERAVGFLASEHPNGALVPRRYARMLGIAVVSVVWWNYIVAPALYGNDKARRYLGGAVQRFDAAAAGGSVPSPSRGFVPTAKLVAPANTLESNEATRYFLFHTEKAKLNLPRHVAGTEWKVYPVMASASDCTDKDNPGCVKFVEFVQNVIFSSGSPFPIFAAHKMQIPGEKGDIRLIDGGYSNVIPIDAARTINAEQALVIHSSPFDLQAKEPGEPAWWSHLVSPGMLIRNAGRLPSFMFERGQQVDRVSRQSLLVVSFAPKVDKNESWPSLAQFDKPTVDHMLCTAQENIQERIGFVESWGEPRFRFNQEIAEEAVPPATK
jgi:hypothetical protein